MEAEKALLLRIREGMPGADAEFTGLFRPRLLRASLGFLGDQQAEAEDMVQDSFLVALPQLEHRVPEGPVYPWLRQICLRLCYARRRSRDGVLLCLDEELRAYMARVDVEPIHSAPAEVQTQQKLELLREVIKQLEPEGRQIIQLRNVHGMSYAQIGAVLALPRAAVVERLSQARGRLRALVEQP